jgi:hypothetical protein
MDLRADRCRRALLILHSHFISMQELISSFTYFSIYQLRGFSSFGKSLERRRK